MTPLLAIALIVGFFVAFYGGLTALEVLLRKSADANGKIVVRVPFSAFRIPELEHLPLPEVESIVNKCAARPEIAAYAQVQRKFLKLAFWVLLIPCLLVFIYSGWTLLLLGTVSMATVILVTMFAVLERAKARRCRELILEELDRRRLHGPRDDASAASSHVADTAIKRADLK